MYNFEILKSLIDYSKDILVSSEENYNYLIGVIIGGILVILSVYISNLLSNT